MKKAYQIISAEVTRRGMSVAELSRRSGIKHELLRRSLCGDRRLQADEFIALCAELGLRLDDFAEVA